jgi:putative transposase
MRFKITSAMQRFVSSHGPISNLFVLRRKNLTAAEHRELRGAAIEVWNEIAYSNAA